jgi:hypothetical protein
MKPVLQLSNKTNTDTEKVNNISHYCNVYIKYKCTGYEQQNGEAENRIE